MTDRINLGHSSTTGNAALDDIWAYLIGNSFLPAGRSAATLQAYLTNNQVYNVLDYGPINTPTATTATIRACIAAALSNTLYRSVLSSPVGADSYAAPTIRFPTNYYGVNDEITIGAAFQIICDDGVFIEQLDPTKRLFVSANTGAGYLARFKGAHFMGGLQQVVLTHGALDTSMNIFEDCHFTGANPAQWALDLNCQGSHTILRRCRILDAPKFMRMIDCDMVVLDECWVNGYAYSTGKKPANTASIEAKCVNGVNSKLLIRGGIWVPEQEVTPANANTRWIDRYDNVSVDAVQVQWGGENSGFPVIYDFGSAAVPVGSPFGQSGGVSLIQCQTSAGASNRVDRGVVVLMTGVPSRIHVESCYDLFGGYVINDQIAGGAAAWIAANTDGNHPRIDIRVLGVQGAGNIPIGHDVVGVPTAITDLDAFAMVFDVDAVGGPSPLSVPTLKAKKRLFAPSKTYPQTLTDTGLSDGYLAVETGNNTLAFQVGGVMYYVKGNPTIPVPLTAIRSTAIATTMNFADGILLVDCTAADVVVTLEGTAGLIIAGKPLAVKRYAGTHNIILTPNGGRTIDGGATATVTSANFVFFANQWFTLP